MVKRLISDGIVDHWHIKGGPMANAILLGSYRQKQNAKGRIEALRRLGYEPTTAALYKEVPRQWLDVKFSGEPLGEEFAMTFPDLKPDLAECVGQH